MEKIFLLAGIHLLALASPGPDFIMVLRSSVSGRIKNSIICCIGISLGVASHLIMVYFGLSLAISQSPILYSLIVILGCLWLLKLGMTAFASKGGNFSDIKGICHINYQDAFKSGFITNLLNPKALVYFVSVISPLVRPGEDNFLFLLVGLVFTLMTFLWFSTLALTLNISNVKFIFEKYAHVIDKIFSIGIIILSIYMLFTELIITFVKFL